MMSHFVAIMAFMGFVHADITRFITYGEWTQSQKVDFAKRCLLSKSVKHLDIHLGEMKCVDTANVLSLMYPKYEELLALSEKEFEKVLADY